VAEFLGDVAVAVDLAAAAEGAEGVGSVEAGREDRSVVDRAVAADLVGRAGAGADRVAAGRVE